MKTIESLDDLSVDELDQIYTTLVKRFGVGERGNIREIGFGLGDGRTSESKRRGEVVFYVRDAIASHNRWRLNFDAVPKPFLSDYRPMSLCWRRSRTWF